MDNKAIFLIGPRACGKTTVGMALAKQLGFEFVDTDLAIEYNNACKIAQIVEQHGWDFFRQCESEALQEVTKKKCVISTGGGMVLAEQNRNFMSECGLVFFLAVPSQILQERLLVHDNERPALTKQGTVQEVGLILKQRLPLYKSTAHYIIDACLPVEQVVKQICTIIDKHYISRC